MTLAAKKEPVNIHGIKEGDIFYTKWGFNCTITDFFQVTKILAPQTVEIRQLQKIVKEQWRDGSTQSVPDPNSFLDLNRFPPQKVRTATRQTGQYNPITQKYEPITEIILKKANYGHDAYPIDKNATYRNSSD